VKRAARIVSWLALAGTLVPPLLFFADRMPLEAVHRIMLLATVAWFAATPFWMDRADGD
jgi:hypothetical protein